jgi:hypothetical protein
MQFTYEPTGATPVPLSHSAIAYLSELEVAAELASIELAEAGAADRRNFLVGPGPSFATGARDGAMNAPDMIVQSRIQDAATTRLEAAKKTYAFTAWWWATSVVSALNQRAVGRETTARYLEQVTLHLRPADRKELEASGWMRPTLPSDGAHDTGAPHIDGPMNAALAELRDAYGAADLAEMILNDPREDDLDEDDLDDNPNGYMSDREAGDLHKATCAADRIPDLLLAYARAATAAARHR